jgi:hypothetical protein
MAGMVKDSGPGKPGLCRMTPDKERKAAMTKYLIVMSAGNCREESPLTARELDRWYDQHAFLREGEDFKLVKLETEDEAR